jgi:pyruvate,orthophosphate dikinase
VERLQKKAELLDKWLAQNQPKRGAVGRENQSNITDNDSAKMMTSHGAVQGDNSQALIDAKAGTMQVGARVLRKGDIITIDGSTGQVLAGRAKMREPELSGAFAILMGWADAERRLRVRANADTPRDAKQARDFGAEGIGLCRTEHMFFEAERILAVRQMILADDAAGRRAALAKILPMQRADFEQLLTSWPGRR